MKHTILKLAAIFTAATCVMGTCKKDDDNNGNPQPTGASIIGTWKATAFVSDRPLTDADGSPFTDLYAKMEGCTQDNLYIYKDGGVLEYNEGATKCHPGDPQSRSFTWVKSGNHLTTSAGVVNADILQLDATTLKYSAPTYFRYTLDQGATYDSTYCVMTLTYQRQ